MNKKKKLDKFAKRRLGLLIVIILIISICLISKFSKNKEKYIDYRLIIGNEYINLKNDIYIDNFENIYISKQDIQYLYDSNIYYDSVDNILITAFNKHLALLKLDYKTIEINGSNIEVEAPLIKVGEEIYLPFSEMGIVYDFEFSYCKETKTIIVDSISEEKKEATVIKKKAKVKQEPKIFSRKIDDVLKDDMVVILDETDEKYYKVRLENGNIGYVDKNKFSDIQIIRENMDYSKIDSLNFLEYTDISKDYSDMEIDTTKPNAVNIDMFTIKDSNVKSNIDIKNKNYISYIKWAEENNIKVVAELTCEDEVINDFLTYSQRNTLINNIYLKMIDSNLTMLNINFRKINDINSYYRFIIELAPKLKSAGIKIIVTNNEILNEEKLEKIVDYLIK